MTDDMTRLRGLAEQIAPADAIEEDDVGFTLAFPSATLMFFSPGGHSVAGYCRAPVAELGGAEFPMAFAEEALNGNFFWRGTGGAVISYEEESGTVWLTDRFDEGAFEDGADFREYVEGFLNTLEDWRERFALRVPASAEGMEA